MFLEPFCFRVDFFFFFFGRGLRPDSIIVTRFSTFLVPFLNSVQLPLGHGTASLSGHCLNPIRSLPRRTCLFSVPTGEVIKAWDIAVATMKVGEVCHITCKPEYAYGSAGSPPKIPPNATLVFEVSVQPQKARQRASLISAWGLAALQPFLPLRNSVAKAEGLPLGEGEEQRGHLALPCT